MRALVAGQPRTLAEVTYAVENARGTMPGTVGRVDNARDALDLLDGSEIVLFLEVSGIDDPQLAQIRTLMMKGATVVVLSKEVSAELRVAAIKAGAREVLFAPWNPDRVQKRLAGAIGQTGTVEIGMSADFRAILLPDGKDPIEARVKTISPAGLTASTGGARVGRDAVMRVAIQVPPPSRLPVLFARCVADNGSGAITMRFVGLTVDEENSLAELLAAPVPGLRRPSLPPTAASMLADPDFEEDGSTRIGIKAAGSGDSDGARAAIGRVIADLDASVLREAPTRWLGLVLPTLTDAERLSMVEGGPLSEVAVWRTRAHVIASILETSPDLSTSELPFEDWRNGLAHARGLIRREVTVRMSEGDQGLLRETRDVQARLNAVSDRIDRLAREAGVDVAAAARGPLERPAGPATFERPAPPPPPSPSDSGPAPASTSRPGRAFRLALLSVTIVVLGAAAAALHFSTQERRTRDIGRTAVAQRPINGESATGLRVRSRFPEPERTVLVVDRSWYDRGYDKSGDAGRDAARVLAAELSLSGRVAVRDYGGRRLTEIDASGSGGSATATATPAVLTSAGAPSAATTTAPVAVPTRPRPGKRSRRDPASPSR